jgi:hypothetical protein
LEGEVIVPKVDSTQSRSHPNAKTSPHIHSLYKIIRFRLERLMAKWAERVLYVSGKVCNKGHPFTVRASWNEDIIFLIRSMSLDLVSYNVLMP